MKAALVIGISGTNKGVPKIVVRHDQNAYPKLGEDLGRVKSLSRTQDPICPSPRKTRHSKPCRIFGSGRASPGIFDHRDNLTRPGRSCWRTLAVANRVLQEIAEQAEGRWFNRATSSRPRTSNREGPGYAPMSAPGWRQNR